MGRKAPKIWPKGRKSAVFRGAAPPCQRPWGLKCYWVYPSSGQVRRYSKAICAPAAGWSSGMHGLSQAARYATRDIRAGYIPMISSSDSLTGESLSTGTLRYARPPPVRTFRSHSHFYPQAKNDACVQQIRPSGPLDVGVCAARLAQIWCLSRTMCLAA
jgi:hypothetical protein